MRLAEKTLDLKMHTSTWCSELRARHGRLLLQGVNVTALREIKLLKELTCPNVVQLVDVFQHKQNLSLVSAGQGLPCPLL